jgi:hypothetical protein
MKFDIWVLFENNITVALKSDNSNGYFTWKLMHIYDQISRSCKWEISGKSCRENQNTHVIFNNFLFRKSRRLLWHIRWSMVELDIQII